MGGSLCGFTALEKLDLRGFYEQKSTPDLNQLVRLRRLELLWCGALREVKLGDVALTSLDQLLFDYGAATCPCHHAAHHCLLVLLQIYAHWRSGVMRLCIMK